jgi:tRNA(Ile)-lysidine synthase
MDSLISKIKRTLVDHKMVEPGDTILLGVSGGPDSVALLRSLVELKQELRIELAIAHLNHSARGEESDRDAQFVKELGGALQIKTLIEKVDVAAEQIASKNSFQETARNLRLDFFQRTMNQIGANKIALGHTSDDQVETVLINLLRGSGLKGVAGMNPVRSPYIRPLFYCFRSEVVGFLHERGFSYCKDSSNEKTDYLRNRIRLELIPFLQENYNPRIVENFFETSGIFRAENDYLEVLSDHEFDRAVSTKPGETDTLDMDIAYFITLPLALKRRVVRKAIQSVKGDLKKISSFHIQEILRLFEKSQKGKRIDLPDSMEILCSGDHVEFKRIPKLDARILSDDEGKTSDWVSPLNIPGETPIEKVGLTLKAEIISPGGAEFIADQGNQAFLDFDKTGDDLVIRFFQAGDRLRPLGMQGTKKLKSLFIDEKVPQEIRSSIPILTTGDNDIIWVYGMRIADIYRVTSSTSKVLFIKGLS